VDIIHPVKTEQKGRREANLLSLLELGRPFSSASGMLDIKAAED
jgi:hypothetical protein